VYNTAADEQSSRKFLLLSDIALPLG